MKFSKTLIGILLTIISLSVYAQKESYYFPPVNTEVWETVSLNSIEWKEQSIDSLIDWLHEKNSKGFIVLHKGKIAVEHYFDQFTSDSLWYWASAGKSLTAFLVGLAQEQGYLNISDTTSKYLGESWTSCATECENKITIAHQLSMTTGLKTMGIDLNCIESECLQYKTDAGERWFYHNAPYRLLQNVVGKAANTTFNLYTYHQLRNRIGLKGSWINYVRYGRARDLARFGLLVLNKGIWDSDTIMHDQNYAEQMVNSSQALNPSYGYLWWLNGKESYVRPGLTISFNGSIVPAAPNDMFAAMGKNDQKIYIVPSMDLVVVRIGNKANESLLALSSFDNELWTRLMKIIDPVQYNRRIWNKKKYLYPNPANDILHLKMGNLPRFIRITDIDGRLVARKRIHRNRKIDISHLKNGTYICYWYQKNKIYREKLIIVR